MGHYHIRWANSKLDWEAFQTEEEAKALAEFIKRPGEHYTIEQLDGDCQSCERLAEAKAALRSGLPNR
jgi:hypothetical protein